MNKLLATFSALVFSVAPAAVATAGDWVTITNDDYGVEMTVPSGTRMVAKEFSADFAGVVGRRGEAEFSIVGSEARTPTLEELQDFTIVLTGIPANSWSAVGEGKSENGWKWWNAYAASNDTHALFAVLAEGKKGAVIVLLYTTQDDLQANAADYAKWFKSVKSL